MHSMTRFAAALLLAFELAAAPVLAEKKVPTPEQVLASYGIASTPESLIKALSSEEPMVRENAALVLGAKRVKEAVPALRNLLGDPYRYAQVAAAGALLRLSDDSGLQILRDALGDPEAAIAAAAGKAIGEAGRDVGYDVLAARLDQGERDARARLLIVRTLPAYRKMRETQVRDDLVKALLRDPAAEVRRGAADELTRFSGAPVRAAFDEVLKKETDQVVLGLARTYLSKSK